MFSFLNKKPIDKLNKQYSALLEQSLAAQRRGDIRGYSELTVEADEVAQKIDALKAQDS